MGTWNWKRAALIVVAMVPSLGAALYWAWHRHAGREAPPAPPPAALDAAAEPAAAWIDRAGGELAAGAPAERVHAWLETNGFQVPIWKPGDERGWIGWLPDGSGRVARAVVGARKIEGAGENPWLYLYLFLDESKAFRTAEARRMPSPPDIVPLTP